MGKLGIGGSGSQQTLVNNDVSLVVEQFPSSWCFSIMVSLRYTIFYRVLPFLVFLFSIVSSLLILTHTVIEFLLEWWKVMVEIGNVYSSP